MPDAVLECHTEDALRGCFTPPYANAIRGYPTLYGEAVRATGMPYRCPSLTRMLYGDALRSMEMLYAVRGCHTEDALRGCFTPRYANALRGCATLDGDALRATGMPYRCPSLTRMLYGVALRPTEMLDNVRVSHTEDVLRG